MKLLLYYQKPLISTKPKAELAAKGVVFAACANAMRAHNLTKNDMLEVAVIVPSAVGELIKKQAHGWAYIRP